TDFRGGKVKLNLKNYQEALQGISIIEVSGESCANCLSLLPILHRIVEARKDCVLHHLEASSETMELIKLFKVEAVPTILIMDYCEVYARCRGYQPSEILEVWIDAKIQELKNIKKRDINV
ncbi:MAG TPA: thioredoxin family protein, partial [Candidatus Pelethenecus sp.]|nr:thioredoxin family protein [Candidatus Pelethenecus sp.]